MRRWLFPLILAGAFVTAAPVTALAQSPSGSGGSWLYGISFGGGRRMTSGTLRSSLLPAGASQPPSPVTVGALDIEGGFKLGGRFAVIGLFERRAAIGQPSGGWGSTSGHAAFRAWVLPRIWVEGGVGPAEIVYRASNQSNVTTWWRPGFEASGGYDIFQGPSVTLHVFVRYSTATFEGLRVQTVTGEFGLLGRR